MYLYWNKEYQTFKIVNVFEKVYARVIWTVSCKTLKPHIINYMHSILDLPLEGILNAVYLKENDVKETKQSKNNLSIKDQSI